MKKDKKAFKIPTASSNSSSNTTTTTTYILQAAIFIAVIAFILAFLRNFTRPLPSTLSKVTSNPATRNMSTTSLKVTPRRSSTRGHADHGWLYTFHTFSFASYFNPQFEQYGPLRVINEDRVERGTGFGTHSHAEFMIWSYIVSGELEHKDSMGNLETLKRGEVQFTNAGTGIRHSEYNRNKKMVRYCPSPSLLDSC
jgi:hypothetical protein